MIGHLLRAPPSEEKKERRGEKEERRRGDKERREGKERMREGEEERRRGEELRYTPTPKLSRTFYPVVRLFP